MLKKTKNTRRSKHGRRANKNIRHSRKQTNKQNSLQRGGSASYNNQSMKDLNMSNDISSSGGKEKFQVTTFRSINQDDLNRFKISNYVNNNIDWGDLMPGPPPTDCCIM